MWNADSVAFTVFPFVLLGLLSLTVTFTIKCQRLAIQAHVEEGVASHEESTKEERRRIRKESISNRLDVKAWAPDDPQVESMEGDQDTLPSHGTAETPQSPAPPINSSPAACAMGSEDCDFLAGEKEMADCAICLNQFKPQQLVCESNNPSCKHTFHKDCMVDWLVNHHDTCPMCREVYLLKTV